MRRVAAILALAALASCAGSPSSTPPVASASAADPAAMAEQLKSKGVIGKQNEDASPGDQPLEDLQPKTAASPKIESRIRYIELTVDQTKPKEQQRLVKYLLNLSTYHLVECRQVGPTVKFWKFMVVDTLTTDSKPQLDLPIDIGPQE